MNPLEPSAGLLAKLGSIAVHIKEMFSLAGHDFDKTAIEGLLIDPEVVEWLEEMDALVMLPRLRGKDKRSSPGPALGTLRIPPHSEQPPPKPPKPRPKGKK